MRRAARHTACYKCRERKVGCNGKQPCSRCEHHGQTCSYPDSRSKTFDDPELMNCLESINERLKQTEERLASRITHNIPNEYLPPSSAGSFDIGAGSWDCFSATSTNGSQSSQAFGPIFDSQELESMMSSVSYGGELQVPMIPLSPTTSVGAISFSQDFAKLHEIYYNTFHHSYPMINRTRLMTQLSGNHPTEASLSLSYAICAQAAPLSPESSNHEDNYYRLARQSLERAEIGASRTNFLGLDALQSLILIAFYELRHGFIPRAGLSVAKAMRLVHMLDLHRIHNTKAPMKIQQSPQASVATQEWVDHEEKCRTFWAAFSIDCLASIFFGGFTSMTEKEEKEITALLPSHDIQPGEEQGTQALSLQASLKESNLFFISHFAAATIMVAILRRTLIHMRNCRGKGQEDIPRYDFWNKHRNIEETLLQTTTALGYTDNASCSLDPNLLFVGFLKQTILMYLHNTAADRARRTKLPSEMISECEKRCTNSAIQLANLIKLTGGDDPFYLPAQRFNPFVMLCVHASSQLLIQSIDKLNAYGDTHQALDILLQFLNHPERTLSSSSIELLASHLLDDCQISI